MEVEEYLIQWSPDYCQQDSDLRLCFFLEIT